MLAHALKLLAAARMGSAVKSTARDLCIQAAVFAIAALLVLAGLVAGLFAAYFALAAAYSPVEAAALLAALLIISGLAVLAGRSVVTRLRQKRRDHPLKDTPTSLHAGAAEVTRALGPAQMVALALMAGVAAGRGLRKS